MRGTSCCFTKSRGGGVLSEASINYHSVRYPSPSSYVELIALQAGSKGYYDDGGGKWKE